MSEYFSEWAEFMARRMESDVSSIIPTRHSSANAFIEPRRHTSANASPGRTDVRLPGGYLVWVVRRPMGRTQVHGCRVHQTVECSIPIQEDLTSGSRIDAYEPPADMAASDSFFPYYPSTSVYVDRRLNPKIVCLSTGLEMFAIEGSGVEAKPVGGDLFDRPSKMVSRRFLGSAAMSSCMRMANGDVYFMATPETAEMSSSSSSSVSSASSKTSVSTMSSSSSVSSQSSSSSTELMTSSSSSSWSSESSLSSSTMLLTTSSSSSMSGTSQSTPSSSSLSSLSTTSMSSSESSESWVCPLWSPVEFIDEAFTDMDGHPGGTGTVGSEFTDMVLDGLTAFNTDGCVALWGVYVPQGTYGVGGSAIGMVYLYKSQSARPAGPPFSNSSLVASFPLDSTTRYGIGWPKVLPIADGGSGSGVSGSVNWYGGIGHGTLLPGCSAYRLRIPFNIRPEGSSLSSPSSISTTSVSTQSSKSSSDSIIPWIYWFCTNVGSGTSCKMFLDPPGPPGPIPAGAWDFTVPITKSTFPDGKIYGRTIKLVSYGTTTYRFSLYTHSSRIGTTLWALANIQIYGSGGFANGWYDIKKINNVVVGQVYIWFKTAGGADNSGLGDFTLLPYY